MENAFRAEIFKVDSFLVLRKFEKETFTVEKAVFFYAFLAELFGSFNRIVAVLQLLLIPLQSCFREDDYCESLVNTPLGVLLLLFVVLIF